jgi:hypothetical protein
VDPDTSCIDKTKNDKKCENIFPKPFVEETTIGNNNYPVYRRRDDGKFKKRDSFTTLKEVNGLIKKIQDCCHKNFTSDSK